ncbi:MAG TPA: bifunctional diaminohydroxyphosphoribosylaminopyrimidine deaminase/5-amino-6-(5-phosphoribosylamino)uracil reductase RibD [Mycobacteriales bacterium]|nr:bifunctional diaminohydroxyphosphoribosylaminopyrimidine deaminase/5-amino-6-(5-phosphoribosylamino)uracil reductase RibD [Mycobacteriales bacterium]
MSTEAEISAMRRAIELAEGALGVPNPNPAVGAVVLDRAGQVVGTGATAPIGGPHAEVVALTAAGERARGGTVVVTLEPCSHQGRTGPCSAAIMAAGISRVVFAVADPHGVAAGGAAQLRDAGIDVKSGVLADDARHDLEPWLVATAEGRPYVTWKYAATLDGRTAAADGTSKWITGVGARLDVQVVRSRSDAVVVGIGTVLADDPALTVREVDVGRQPLRVVVDSDARTPLGAKVLDEVAPTLIAVAGDAPADRVAALRGTAAEVVELPRTSAGVDLGALMGCLFEQERRLLVLEGGATLATGFLRAGLVDRVIAYIAPALLGAGSSVVGDFGVATIDRAVRLMPKDLTYLDGDVRIVATVEKAEG